jgi:protease-4
MIVFRLLRALFALIFLPLRAWRRARAVPANAYVHLTIDGPLADIVSPRRLLGEIFRKKHTTGLHALAQLVDALVRDPRPRGIAVTIRAIGAGMASATSLRNLLRKVKDAGKEVVVLLPLGGDTAELYVASVAHRIYVGPQTTLAPVGFMRSVRYLKKTLDKTGVEADVIACGRYKSAGEQLVLERMSDAQREQLEAVLGLFHDQVVDAVAEGRKIDREKASALLDDAPYRAERAHEVGLVDGAAYEDELPGKLGSPGAPARLVDAARYFKLATTPLIPPILSRPKIGVIRVHGAIAGGTPAFANVASDEAIIATIRAARLDRRIRGVILHVDSPGGSALASDRIHHELERLAEQKPLVACMANVAASGGYYVAAAARTIVAEPTTITGSIGVVAARVILEPLLDRFGVVTERVYRGARAGLLEPGKRLTPDEHAAVEREIRETYGGFVGVVARGRGLSREEVEKVAQGRVWTGRDALEHKLVDMLGGFDVALERARALTSLPNAHLFEPVVVRAPRRHVPPLDPPLPRRALAKAMADLGDLLGLDLGILPLAQGRDRVLAWCRVSSWFL